MTPEADGRTLNKPRAALLSKDSPHRELPPVTIAPYLLQYACELGLQKHTAQGPVPVDWVDVKAWAQLTGTELLGEEARIIRQLSFAYVSQYNLSKPHDAPVPNHD